MTQAEGRHKPRIEYPTGNIPPLRAFLAPEPDEERKWMRKAQIRDKKRLLERFLEDRGTRKFDREWVKKNQEAFDVLNDIAIEKGFMGVLPGRIDTMALIVIDLMGDEDGKRQAVVEAFPELFKKMRDGFYSFKYLNINFHALENLSFMLNVDESLTKRGIGGIINHEAGHYHDVNNSGCNLREDENRANRIRMERIFGRDWQTKDYIRYLGEYVAVLHLMLQSEFCQHRLYKKPEFLDEMHERLDEVTKPWLEGFIPEEKAGQVIVRSKQVIDDYLKKVRKMRPPESFNAVFKD